MKIRNKRLLQAAGWLGGRLAIGLVRSLRVQTRCGGELELKHTIPPPGPRCIYCIWHENLLLPAIWHGGDDLAVLISKHADGRLLGGLIEALGMEQVQGSTNRGGVEAVRQLVRGEAGRRHLAVTPDGPRGPRRVVQSGIVYIASRTGMHIVPIGVGYRDPWRLKSWDRFAIPKPGSAARLVPGDPIFVPDRLRTPDLEPYRERVQAEMDRLGSLAETWAKSGRFPAEQALARRAA